MAEYSLFNTAGQIILKLGSRAVREVAVWRGVQAEIDKLKDTVSTIRAVLLDAERKQGHSEQVKDWLRKLKNAMDDAKDLLDEIFTEALQRQEMDGSRLTKQVCVFFSRSNQFAYSLKMVHKIKSLRERLAGINADRQCHLEVGNPGESWAVMGKMDMSTDSGVVIGREEAKKEVIKLLLDSLGGEGVSVVPIVGIGGLGKTTLAQLIFNDEQIKACFELRTWVSNDFELYTIVHNILESATRSKPQGLRTSVLTDHLQKTISGKKFLLVLDDVPNTMVETVNYLKTSLSGGVNGSKILLTTRSKHVAQISSRISPYMLEGLSKDDSWLLFKQYAFHRYEECRIPRLEEIGREIVRKCVGVPLAIRTIGRVLYFMNTEAEWLAFKDNELSWAFKADHFNLMHNLKLSYYHLPFHLKYCFAYCSLFPKDYRIPVGTLIQLWIAQGIVTRSSHARECLEDIGLEFFKELLWRSFFQEVEYDEWGNIESCKMHSLMRVLAVIEAAGLKFTDHSFALNFKSSERHKLDNWEAKRLMYLDLSYNDDMRVLPNSITKLRDLQVLKLCHCKSLAELPKDIRKLINLGCLDCWGCDNLTHMPRGLGQLTSLWSLTVFVVGQGSGSSRGSKLKYQSGGLEELHALNNLRGSLQIKNLRNVRNGVREFEAANLKEKNLLQSLDLDWGREVGYNWAVGYNWDREERCFQILQLHPNLKGLRVAGYGGVRFPSWFSSLTNLVRITISNCRRCQYLPSFHQLPSLQELFISVAPELEYMVIEENDGEINNAESSSSSTFFFPSLKKLSLEDCPKLKGWWKNQGGDADDGNNSAATSTNAATVPLKLPHFRRLSKLSIWRCPNLTQMPLFPSVTDELSLQDTSLEPLRQTMEMKGSSPIATSSSSSGTPVIHPPSPLSELKQLNFIRMRGLVSLPEEWLQNLTSLQLLRINDCPNLTLLPQGIKHYLPSLQSLSILACPQLEERCGNKRGADWPIISRIPNINIGFENIQREGQYLLDG